MGNDDFGMTPKLALDPTRLPIPEDHVTFCISARDPLAIRRKANLAGIPSHGMASKSLLPVLPEIVRIVEQDLVV